LRFDVEITKLLELAMGIELPISTFDIFYSQVTISYPADKQSVTY